MQGAVGGGFNGLRAAMSVADGAGASRIDGHSEASDAEVQPSDACDTEMQPSGELTLNSSDMSDAQADPLPTNTGSAEPSRGIAGAKVAAERALAELTATAASWEDDSPMWRYMLVALRQAKGQVDKAPAGVGSMDGYAGEIFQPNADAPEGERMKSWLEKAAEVHRRKDRRRAAASGGSDYDSASEGSNSESGELTRVASDGGALPAEEHKISSFATSQPTAVLNTGCRIPLIGFRLGTFKADEKTTREALASALKAGYRHIDSASHYLNEPAIGKGLHAALKAGYAKREDLFITFKLWNTDHAAEDVRPALEATLGDLRTSYLDLYLIHWPVTEHQKKGVRIDPGIRETWTAMEELVDMGLVRNIGVSNFSIRKLEEILSFCRIRPSVNQVEVHPIWRNDELIAYCNDHGIHHGTSTIAKSSNPCHIKSNLEDVLNFELAKEDYDRISALDFQLRLVDGIGYLRPEGPYRTMKDLWDEDKTEAWRTRFIYKFPDMPTVQLSSGLHMPILGVGCTWLKQNVKDTVKFALRSGFRHIDVSSQRGNEAQIGAALLEVCKMLAALNVDYLDLCLLPAHNNMTAFKAAWTTMEALVDEGKLRCIGLQDASIEQLAEVMGSARILPVINSVEVHPGNRNDALLAFCRCQGVHVMASSWLATAYMLQHDVPALLRKPLVTNIARSMGKRPAQVLIRWALQHGTSISPKAGSPEHVQGILDVLNWELSGDDYRR
ncbi:hypothetical protein WJX75_004875 [Coccomyxa subellipsoidea]|uniref:NADP-dependent oxidoreductase domain-containing protein n=1 Tax=Coccomyxa subellipsoidea TaxID=248742 RepID=A0ABR2YW08_9CHLO